MLCNLAQTLGSPFGDVLCQRPIPGLAEGLGLAFILSALAAAARVGGPRGWLRAGLFVVVAGLLALAAQRPVLQEAPPDLPDGGLLVVLVDGSDSFWRTAESATGALAGLADRVAEALGRQDPGPVRHEILTFGTSAESRGAPGPLTALPLGLKALRVAHPAEASDIEAGLRLALSHIRKDGGRGAVVLVADGRFPMPSAATLAEARALGVPIHVLGAGSDHPAAGIVGADLGPEQWVGRVASLRLATLGGGQLSALTDDGSGLDLDLADPGVIAPARLGLTFAGRGLRHVALDLAQGETRAHRVLYTLVRGPSRLLVFGAARWIEGLDPALWQVTRGDPLHPPRPSDFDAVVIDALSPKDFAPGYDQTLLEAAQTSGLLIVNGALRGAPTEVQRIGDWTKSALDPILPVDSDPRKFVEDPPPRDVVIMVDVSDSMDGAPLESARAAAKLILGKLRPKDSLAIIPFASGDIPSFGPAPMDASGKAQAMATLDGLTIDGGTEPDQAFAKADRLASNYCSFFFLSDFNFAVPATSPRCYTYFLPIRPGSVEADVAAALSASGDIAAPIPPGSAPGNLKFGFLEPKTRDIFWRDGSFLPKALQAADPRVAPVPLPGLAIAYPRADADPVPAIHPEKEKDPVMVFRHDPDRPGLATGAVLSDLSPWQGQPAIEAILGEMVGWTDPDRFDIRLTQGPETRLTIRQLDRVADGSLRASLVAEDGSVRPIALQPGRDPGEFQARLDLPMKGGRGLLVIDEAGHPSQRIPLTYAGASEATMAHGAESFDFGVDPARLAAIASATGGQVLTEGMPFPLAPRAEALAAPSTALGLGLISLAGLLLSLAFWIGGRRE